MLKFCPAIKLLRNHIPANVAVGTAVKRLAGQVQFYQISQSPEGTGVYLANIAVRQIKPL